MNLKARITAACRAFLKPHLLYGYLSGAEVLRHAADVAARAERSDQTLMRLRSTLAAVESSLKRGDTNDAILRQWFPTPGTRGQK